MFHETVGFDAVMGQLDPELQAMLSLDQNHTSTQVFPTVSERAAGSVATAVLPEATTASVARVSAAETTSVGFDAVMGQLDPELQAMLSFDQTFQAPQVAAEAPSVATTAAVAADLAGDWFEDFSARSTQWLEANKPDFGTAEDLKISLKSVARKVGYATLAIVGLTAGLLAYAEFGPRGESSAQVATQPKIEEVSTTLPPAPSTTVTIPATPETTTTTAPAPEPAFIPKPGESVGTFILPEVLCSTEVQVGEYSEFEDVNHVVGTGDAFIDQKIADPTPDEGCDARTERELQHEAETDTDFIGRPDRVRNWIYSSQNTTGDGSSVGPGNPDGKANHWLPIAGHVTSVQGEGIYTSALPGNPGNTVISGHGSTYGAGFGDVALMKIGDTGEFKRADGKNFVYEVIGSEVVPANQYEKIIKYSNPSLGENAATGSIFYCTGTLNGDPGTGDAYRGVKYVVFTQVG